jgi:serine/threonine-protein kinase
MPSRRFISLPLCSRLFQDGLAHGFEACSTWRSWLPPLRLGSASRDDLSSRSDVSTVPSRHFSVLVPDIGQQDRFELLRDGTGVVYRGSTEGSLYLYTFGNEASRRIAETEGAQNPFTSPDGKWLGFTARNQLLKVSLDGGSAAVVSDSTDIISGSHWGTDGQIVVGRVGSGLALVPESGGALRPLTTLSKDETGHVHPMFLPGGRAVLFTTGHDIGADQGHPIEVVVRATGERRVLVTGGASGQYVPSGHVIYQRDTDLFAAPFDLDGLVLTAAPVRVISGVFLPTNLGGQVRISDDGMLAYLPGGGAELERSIVWTDAKGAARTLPGPALPYTHLSLLPNARDFVVEIEVTPHNIWRYDALSGALTPLTNEGGNHRPVVSADGRRMVFSSDRTVPRSLYLKATDGSGSRRTPGDQRRRAQRHILVGRRPVDCLRPVRPADEIGRHGPAGRWRPQGGAPRRDEEQ